MTSFSSVPMGSMVMRIRSPAVERKRVRRNDAGAGHEEGAVGKAVVAEQILDKSRWCALQLGERSVGGKCSRAAAHNLKTNRRRGRQRLRRDEHAGPERATAVVDLGLRQIERILSLDIARAHVVADGVADDLAAIVDEQRQLRLGHVPLGVAANAHVASRSGDAAGRGLEEKLRPLGGIDAIVEVAAAGRLSPLPCARCGCGNR